VNKLFLLLGLVPTLSLASPFTGTWQLQPELTKFREEPLKVILDQGRYKRLGCINAVDVGANGSDQSVDGHPDFDSITVAVLDGHQVRITQKKAGKATWTGLYTVAADGHTMKLDFTDTRALQPVTGEMLYERVSDSGISGDHALSGAWRPEKVVNISTAGRKLTFKDTAGGLAMTAADGHKYEAKFDFKDYPVEGDVSDAKVALNRVGPQVVQFSLKRGNALAEVSRATVSDDGHSLKLTAVDRECMTVTDSVWRKAD
jgi:hypothetical protein